MKITKVEIFHVKHEPEVSGFTPVIVRIHTDEGIHGVGELALAYGTGSQAGVGMLRQMAERFLLGADPFRIEEMWHTLYHRTFWGQGGGPVVYGAISAIDEALWDVKGKALRLRRIGKDVKLWDIVLMNDGKRYVVDSIDYSRAIALDGDGVRLARKEIRIMGKEEGGSTEVELNPAGVKKVLPGKGPDLSDFNYDPPKWLSDPTPYESPEL